MSELTWLYAVVRGPTEPPGRGVAGEKLRTVAHGGLAAVVGSVPETDFGTEPLRRHLADARWLEDVARAHHAVVAALSARGPTVPLRLATVYRDDTGVTAMLAERRAALTAMLTRLAGRTEWGVKVFGAPSAPAPEPAVTTGTSYLMRRRAQRDAAAHAAEALAEAAERVHETLAAQAIDARYHPAVQTAGGDPLALNASYLVDDEHAERFRQAVVELAEQHPQARVMLTGPWPAYTFTDLEDER